MWKLWKFMGSFSLVNFHYFLRFDAYAITIISIVIERQLGWRQFLVIFRFFWLTWVVLMASFFLDNSILELWWDWESNGNEIGGNFKVLPFNWVVIIELCLNRDDNGWWILYFYMAYYNSVADFEKL